MNFLKQVFDIAVRYRGQLFSGVGITMLIALSGTLAGLLIGLLTGVIRTAPLSRRKPLRVLHKILNGVLAAYIEVFRGTPMMVQAMVIFWGFAFANGGQTLPLIPAGIVIVSSTRVPTWQRSCAAVSFRSTAGRWRARSPSV